MGAQGACERTCKCVDMCEARVKGWERTCVGQRAGLVSPCVGCSSCIAAAYESKDRALARSFLLSVSSGKRGRGCTVSEVSVIGCM